MYLPLYPIWIVDLIGSAAMIVVSFLCLRRAWSISREHPDNAMAAYMLWFTVAIFAFSASRSLGHIGKHILYFTGHMDLWQRLAPVSGSINTLTFVLIASVTLFFHQMQRIMGRMAEDQQKIKQTSRELLELSRDIEEIASERTRAEMALRIAHEVRNPVMIIGGLLRRLMKRQQTDSAVCDQEHFSRIMEQARNLEKLVGRFERLMPETAGRFSCLDLNSIVDEAVTAVSTEAEMKGITLEVEKAPAALTFRGNRQLMKLALIHILRNAIEACHAGDRITVSTHLGPAGVHVRITDTGPGIPGPVLEHIFEPFYETSAGHTGLGLPYVKQIIEEHRGRLKIESTPGAGTSVEIELPTHVGELGS